MVKFLKASCMYFLSVINAKANTVFCVLKFHCGKFLNDGDEGLFT